MKIERPALYLVGTPIGNLDDMSPRAKEILAECDFVAAEDTRVSSKLLSVFGIKNQLISYFEHNKGQRGAEIISRLQEGLCCALITDAGMPAISDPGEDIVRLCAENDIPVYSVPGPCAAVAALSVSGLPTAKFVFEGFLDAKKNARKSRLEELAGETRTLIFYEAPHKLRSTLEDIAEVFGGTRKISLVRELTKLHEEVVRTTAAEAVAIYEEKEPRGEFVLVVAGASEQDNMPELGDDAVIAKFEEFVSAGFSKKYSLKQTADFFGVSKNQIYPICMKK